MAHEIHSNDSIILNRVPAWHELGNVVDKDLSPREALIQGNLDWKVGFPDEANASFAGQIVPIQTSRALYRLPRNDEEEYLEIATHGLDYHPLQNETLFDLAYALGADVKVESAGSLFNCKKVFITLRGETFGVRNDQIDMYVALMNSHDGSLALTFFPTSTRIVCNNTLTQAIKNAKDRKYACRHFKKMDNTIEDMKFALAHFAQTGEVFKQQVQTLAEIKIKNEAQLREFFLKSYVEINGAKAINLETPESKEEMTTIFDSWQSTMEVEQIELGEDSPTLWLAANAVTDWIQHSEPKRRAKDWQLNRSFANVAGKTADLSGDIMNLALQYA